MAEPIHLMLELVYSLPRMWAQVEEILKEER